MHRIPRPGRIRAWRLLFVVSCGCLAAGIGCVPQTPPGAFVARVGDVYLTQEQIDAALENLPARLDSTEARRQFIDQWVTNELLYQEALQRNLRSREAVQRQLQESERSVLIDALVSELFAEERAAPNPAEIRAYYERHKEQLRLREPFVRVRYLATTRPDSARLAHSLLAEARTRADEDSVWNSLATRFAEDAAVSLSLAQNYFPESRLFMEQPALHDALSRLAPGHVAPLIEANGHTHLLQLADRVAAEAIPEPGWIEDQIRRQLTMDARKQMYERQVQRLRTEALSRDALVIR